MANNYKPLYHSDINETFIIDTENESATFSACTGFYTNNIISCSGDSTILLSSGVTEFNTNIEPNIDNNVNIGSPVRRFRKINALSGTTSIWEVTIKVVTPKIELGLDSDGINREITADSSIIQDDTLLGGTY